MGLHRTWSGGHLLSRRACSSWQTSIPCRLLWNVHSAGHASSAIRLVHVQHAPFHNVGCQPSSCAAFRGVLERPAACTSASLSIRLHACKELVPQVLLCPCSCLQKTRTALRIRMALISWEIPMDLTQMGTYPYRMCLYRMSHGHCDLDHRIMRGARTPPRHCGLPCTSPCPRQSRVFSTFFVCTAAPCMLVVGCCDEAFSEHASSAADSADDSVRESLLSIPCWGLCSRALCHNCHASVCEAWQSSLHPDAGRASSHDYLSISGR